MSLSFLTSNLQTLIYTTGALLVFASLSCKRIISLRLLYLTASIFYIFYGIYQKIPEIIFWNSVNLVINSIRIYLDFLDSMPWFIYGEDLVLFNGFFKHYMLPGQFRKFIKLAEKKEYKNCIILGEGVTNRDLFFDINVNGRLVVEKSDRTLAELPEHAFFGEMSFLKQQKTNAQIRIDGTVKCFYWSEAHLLRLKKNRLDAYNILTLILSHDLIKKLDKPLADL